MGFAPLLDGAPPTDVGTESTDAYPKHGGAATYRIENAAVVGTTTPNSENTFLCTNETFDDFELEFETMVHDSLNSGVQIRSHVRPEDDRVYGPQVSQNSAAVPGRSSHRCHTFITAASTPTSLVIGGRLPS